KQSSLLAVASVGAGIGALAAMRGDSGLNGVLPQTGPRPEGRAFPRGPPFPKGAGIPTLLEDLPPQALASGAVLFHSRLSIHEPLASHYPASNALAARQGAPPPQN